MVIIVGKQLQPIYLAINPFSQLGITKDATHLQTKTNFRKKMIDARNDDKLRIKICLAYDMILNKEFYREIEDNIFIVKHDLNKIILGYYYVVIGDFLKFVKEAEENPDILNYKDPLKRNLLYIAARNGHTDICEYLINKGIEINDIQNTGSTPLHGAVYYGQTKVVQLLLNYGAKTNIRNKYNHLPIDEAGTDEIKNLLKESEKDPIVKLYNSLFIKNVANSLIPVSIKGEIIAKKITCKLINLGNKNEQNKINKTWIPAWHGTNFNCIESIAEIGLKPAGGKLKNGNEIQVCVSHIGRDRTVDKIKDWANGIFVSPSIFYSAYPAYAKEIISKNESYKILVEVRVKPNSYYARESTCPKYKPKIGEPKMLEYRIDAKNEEDVQVVSLTFVKNNFFEKAKNFQDGNIFITNNI